MRTCNLRNWILCEMYRTMLFDLSHWGLLVFYCTDTQTVLDCVSTRGPIHLAFPDPWPPPSFPSPDTPSQYLDYDYRAVYRICNTIAISSIGWQYGIKNKAAIASQCKSNVKLIAALHLIKYSRLWWECKYYTVYTKFVRSIHVLQNKN